MSQELELGANLAAQESTVKSQAFPGSSPIIDCYCMGAVPNLKPQTPSPNPKPLKPTKKTHTQNNLKPQTPSQSPKPLKPIKNTHTKQPKAPNSLSEQSPEESRGTHATADSESALAAVDPRLAEVALVMTSTHMGVSEN